MSRLPKTVQQPLLRPPVKISGLNSWIAQRAQQDTLRFITCGSVDDGKSTLIGRLLWESQQIFDDQLAELAVDSKRHGTQAEQVDLALLVDGLAAEREQGITIDVAYRFFSTPRRKFIVADTPGHEQYTRNMITGASSAEVAVVLVDARHGLQTQTRRHARLASLMGIRHIALAINKMDLVQFDKACFQTIAHEFEALANELGIASVTSMPLSALQGDNITHRSKRTPWYSGPTLMAYLENITVDTAKEERFVFPIQWVNRPHENFRGLSGTVASGHISVGESVRVTASGQTSQIEKIVTFDGDMARADKGSAVTLVLSTAIDASRGDILASAVTPLEMTDQFSATIIWMHEDAGLIGRSYDLKLATQWAGVSITGIKHRIDVNTGAHEPCRQLGLNDIAECNLALSRPVVFDTYRTSPALGSFILVDRFSRATVAAGLVAHNLRRAQNVHRQLLSITRQDRERLNNHQGKVIWFTGLSGSGKSTIANALEKELHAQGKRTYILDGDNIRQGLNKDLGFTDADRVENIRRAAEVAKLMMDAGLIVMTAFISPFRAERQMARELIGEENFIEVFIDTPLEVCEHRDPKGLYKKARHGLLPNMTGINSPYEPPDAPAVVVEAATTATKDAVAQVMRALAATSGTCA
ncbi:MAG: sulfate adenylyltransferase subunit CysN [Ottowia sp.]|uniref:sulfate adenylyltransferase subunit CysN n=1 Tax=Ottowia sp. TaxID=1898956 RepID=UPI003C762B97